MPSATRSIAAAALAVAALSAPALADDLTPPPWRGQPDTTFQHWDFHTGPSGGAPDGPPAYINPNGVPQFIPSNPANWIATLNGRNDVWAVNDVDPLHFHIPNDNMPNAQKEIWLQVTFLSTPPLAFGISITSPSGNFALVGAPVDTPLAGGWTHELTHWSLNACPPFENITITPPIPGTVLWIDQVVVDTRCTPVPAPGAAALMLLGAASVRRRSRAGVTA